MAGPTRVLTCRDLKSPRAPSLALPPRTTEKDTLRFFGGFISEPAERGASVSANRRSAIPAVAFGRTGRTDPPRARRSFQGDRGLRPVTHALYRGAIRICEWPTKLFLITIPLAQRRSILPRSHSDPHRAATPSCAPFCRSTVGGDRRRQHLDEPNDRVDGRTCCRQRTTSSRAVGATTPAGGAATTPSCGAAPQIRCAAARGDDVSWSATLWRLTASGTTPCSDDCDDTCLGCMATTPGRGTARMRLSARGTDMLPVGAGDSAHGGEGAMASS